MSERDDIAYSHNYAFTTCQLDELLNHTIFLTTFVKRDAKLPEIRAYKIFNEQLFFILDNPPPLDTLLVMDE